MEKKVTDMTKTSGVATDVARQSVRFCDLA